MNQIDQQTHEVIMKVATKYRKYKFGYFTEDDIEQECYIFALDGLKNYDGRGPLENFLSVHVRNRLLNLKRKMCLDYEEGLEKYTKSKYLVMYPIDLDEVDTEGESSMVHSHSPLGKLSTQEFLQFIDDHLDVSLRLDYLKFKEGVKLTKTRREVIKRELLSILELYYFGKI